MTNDKKNPIEPVKAYKNLDFLNSPAARSIRVQCELVEPEARFERNHVHNTIVAFGSARTKPEDEARAELEAVEAEIAGVDTPTAEQQERLRTAKIRVKTAPFYHACVEFAAKMTEWSKTFEDPEQQFHIVTGGGPGIMEAGNRGAYNAGGKSIGLGISLPFEQGLNDYCSDDLGLEFHYFFIRKYWFLYLAKAIVVFPGGFGTMDELFEMLTLVQTKKTQKHVPFVLFGSDFWNNLINFDTFVEYGVISPGDVNLFRVMDDVDEVCSYVQSELTEHYLK